MLRSLIKLSPRVWKYYSNKLRGGKINQQGNTYEQYFVCYKIVELCGKCSTAHLQTYTLSTQVDAFVDDLCIVNSEGREYFQLRSSKKLSWGSSVIGTLHFDFRRQARIEETLEGAFRLYLVTAYPELKTTLINKQPKSLKSCTDVVLFPYEPSISLQIQNTQEFKDALGALSGLTQASHDKLEALASHILGVWCASNKTDVSVATLLDKVRSQHLACVLPQTIVPLQATTIRLLDQLPGFRYTAERGYFEWSYRNTTSGVVPYAVGTTGFNRIEEELAQYSSLSFDELEPILDNA